MQFKDTDENLYYTDDDTLYVEGGKVNFKRKIGKLTTNIDTGKSTLVIYRSREEKTNFGWMLSAVPLKHLDIATVAIIVQNERIYLLDWENTKEHYKEWTFRPHNGMELQVVIPDPHWTEVKQDTGIIVND